MDPCALNMTVSGLAYVLKCKMKKFSIKSTKPIDKVGNVCYYDVNTDEGQPPPPN